MSLNPVRVPKWLRRRAQFLALSAVCLGISFLLENASEFVKARRYCEPGGPEQPFLAAGNYYHRLTRVFQPQSRNLFTRVIRVTSQSGPDGVIHSSCVARELHSRLLSTLASWTRPPAVVVLDYEYTTDNCTPEMPQSKALREALALATQRFPVVLGLGDLDQAELEDEGLTDKVPRRLTPAEGVVNPRQWYPLPESQSLRYGLLRLHCDVERIPLTWSTYLDRTLTVGRELPTITEVAATLFDANAVPAEFRQRSRKGEDALTTLLREVRGYDARDVLRGGQAVINDLAAHVLVICDYEGDLIATPSGPRIPGGLFHASYIGSVLGGTYSWPAPQIVAVLASFLWFAVIEFIFDKLKDSPFRAAVYSTAASAGFLALLFWFIVKLFDYYILVWPPSAAFLAGKVWTALQPQFFRAKARASGR